MSHEEILELLPWYANGTLDRDERRAVDAHLRRCDSCPQELRLLAPLAPAAAELDAAAPSPSRDLLALTLARIEASGEERLAEPAWTGWWRSTPSPARLLLAGQLALLLIVGSLLAWRSYPAGKPGGRVVTAGAGPVSPQPDRARIEVGFAPGLTEEELRLTLQELKGQIVQGPSTLGLYSVELPFEHSDEEAMARALAELRAKAEVVDYAEPLSGIPEPP